MLALLIVIPFIFFVLYINAISKTLRAIDPEMRTQSPAMAWLLLIPVFNVIWFFFLIKAIQEGFGRMQDAGRLKKEVDTGYNMGLAAGVCWVASIIPRLMFLAFIPLFVFSVLHWNKLQKARQAVIQ